MHWCWVIEVWRGNGTHSVAFYPRTVLVMPLSTDVQPAQSVWEWRRISEQVWGERVTLTAEWIGPWQTLETTLCDWTRQFFKHRKKSVTLYETTKKPYNVVFLAVWFFFSYVEMKWRRKVGPLVVPLTSSPSFSFSGRVWRVWVEYRCMKKWHINILVHFSFLLFWQEQN